MPLCRVHHGLFLLFGTTVAIAIPTRGFASDGLSGSPATVELSANAEVGKIDRAAFSPDGAHLVLFGSGSRVTVWDARGQQMIAIHGSDPTPKNLLGVTAGGRSVFAWDAVGGGCAAWDTRTGAERAVFQRIGQEATTGGNCTGAVSPDGARVATVHDGGGCATHLRVWDATTGKELWDHNIDGGAAIIFAVAFSPDGQTLAAATQRGQVELFDAATGRATANLASKGWVTQLCWSADGKRLATVRRSTGTSLADVWDVATGTLAGTAGPLERQVVGLAVSPDGERVALLDGADPDDIRLRLWTVREPSLADSRVVAGGRALVWTADGKSVTVFRESSGKQESLGKHELLLFRVN